VDGEFRGTTLRRMTYEYATAPAPETEALLARVSPEGARLVLALLREKAADPRKMVPRKVSCEIGGWGQTVQIEKEKRGDLQTILAGASRLTFVPSLYDHLIELAIATHPTGQPPKKARQPSQRFVGRRRSPTPQELEGLKKGNEKRRLEAEARRTAREEGKATAKRPTLIDT
jgi:hypothetical protein